MKEALFLAIDLGTSFIKAGVYDTESVCIAMASEAVKDERPSPGVFIQKGEDLFGLSHCLYKTDNRADRRPGGKHRSYFVYGSDVRFYGSR